jgi:hypothetical protein
MLRRRLGWKLYFWLYAPVMGIHAANAVRYLAHQGLYAEFWLFLLQGLRFASVGLYAWRRAVFTPLVWRLLFALEIADFLFFQGVKFAYLLKGIPYQGPGWPQHESYSASVLIFLFSILFLSGSYVASFLYAFRSKELWSAKGTAHPDVK